MNIKCLPRIRGVPTSFYKLNMMFSTNQGTPQDYSSLHQIKAVAHMCYMTAGANPSRRMLARDYEDDEWHVVCC